MTTNRLSAPAAGLLVLLLAGCTAADPADGAGASPTSPGPSPAPSTAPVSGGASDVAGGVPTTIPEDFVLPGYEQIGDFVDPEVVMDAEFAGLGDPGFDVCPIGTPPGTTGLTDSRFYSVQEPEHFVVRGVMVFESADAAVANLDAFDDWARACIAGEPLEPGVTIHTDVELLSGAWADGEGITVVAVVDSGDSADAYPPTGTYLQAVRIGSAIAVSVDAAEYFFPDEGPFTVSPEMAEQLRGPVDDAATRMCLWTVAGC